jgi:ABC-type cobalamin/Fe3+-siderophores transport system ATPase subunit
MTWRLPHILVLDEPTNHLDMGKQFCAHPAVKKNSIFCFAP